MILFGVLCNLLMTHNMVSGSNSTLVPSNVQLPDWGPEAKQINEEILAERRESHKKLIDNIAFRGDPLKDYKITIREMNFMMRDNYNEMIKQVGLNVYPLIVATDTAPGIGGEYSLYLPNGTTLQMKPTPADYEIIKSVAHLTLGVFTIISPYFNNPSSTGWHGKLQAYHKKVKEGLTALQNSGLKSYSELCENPVTMQDQEKMFLMADEYISNCLKTKNVNYNDYVKFATAFKPITEKSFVCATQIQTLSALPELKRWKAGLGKQWRDVYVIIPEPWLTTKRNPRLQMFEKLLDADRVKTHIIQAGGIKQIDDARLVLGRIIADRTMAHLTFGYDSSKMMEYNMAASTGTNLAGPDTTYVWKNMQSKRKTRYY